MGTKKEKGLAVYLWIGLLATACAGGVSPSGSATKGAPSEQGAAEALSAAGEQELAHCGERTPGRHAVAELFGLWHFGEGILRRGCLQVRLEPGCETDSAGTGDDCAARECRREGLGHDR